MISPQYLNSNGVPVYRTVQKEGEFVITLPGAYHAGFSLGLNIAEANNLACESWLDHAEKAYDICWRSWEKIPVYPLEWLIVENIRKFEFIDLPKETWKKVWKLYVSIIMEEKKSWEECGVDWTFIIPDRHLVDEDANPCDLCTDLCYLSFIRCSECKQNYCTWHTVNCDHSKDKISLYIWYTMLELEQYYSNFKNYAYLSGTKSKHGMPQN